MGITYISSSDGAQSTNSNSQSRKRSEFEVVGSFVSSVVVGDDQVQRWRSKYEFKHTKQKSK
jgi:hypothetical protein